MRETLPNSFVQVGTFKKGVRTSAMQNLIGMIDWTQPAEEAEDVDATVSASESAVAVDGAGSDGGIAPTAGASAPSAVAGADSDAAGGFAPTASAPASTDAGSFVPAIAAPAIPDAFDVAGPPASAVVPSDAGGGAQLHELKGKLLKRAAELRGESIVDLSDDEEPLLKRGRMLMLDKLLNAMVEPADGEDSVLLADGMIAFAAPVPAEPSVKVPAPARDALMDPVPLQFNAAMGDLGQNLPTSSENSALGLIRLTAAADKTYIRHRTIGQGAPS